MVSQQQHVSMRGLCFVHFIVHIHILLLLLFLKVLSASSSFTDIKISNKRELYIEDIF